MLHRRNDRGDTTRPARRRRFILSTLVAAVVIGVLNVSCIGHLLTRTTTIHLDPILDSLSARYPEHFTNSAALIVLVDTSPCGKALHETVWWREWQQTASTAGINFLFVTSESDSADVAVAARLDSVTAPVLVLPSYKHLLSEAGIHHGMLPMKILIDQEGKLVYCGLPILTEERSAELMDKISELGRKGK